MTLLRARLTILAFVLALVPGHAALASPSELAPDLAASVPGEYAQMDDDALLELFRTSMLERSAGGCEVKSLVSEMRTRDAFSKNTAPIYAVASAECAVERRDWKLAYRHVQEWEAMERVEPPVAAWAFRIAFLAGERDQAMDRLEAIARLDEPDQLLSLTDKILFHMIREFRREDAESAVTLLFGTLVQSPHFPSLQTDIRSAAAAHILGQRLKKGDQNSAEAMLADIASPHYYA